MPDLLSKFLETLSPRCYVATGMDAPMGLALRYGSFSGIKLMCVERGVFYASPSAEADERIELREGDSIALAAPKSYILATSRDAAPREARTTAYRLSEGLALYGNPEEASVRIFGGKMQPDAAVAPFFFSALPSYLVIRSDEGGEAIRSMMRTIHFERLLERPGSEYAASRLIDLVMLEVMRFALRSPDAGRTGLFLAMRDKRLMHALWLMHTEPARSWTLDELAAAANMSRPRFSEHFRCILGTPPMEYLARWRIRLAVQRLRDTDEAVKSIAASLGFASATAFGRVFRRYEEMTSQESRLESRCALCARLQNPAPADNIAAAFDANGRKSDG